MCEAIKTEKMKEKIKSYKFMSSFLLTFKFYVGEKSFYLYWY